MFELAPRLLAVLDAGEPVVVATAVSMQGSAPSGVGTSMAVLPGGQVVGTISGGCVEGSLFDTAAEVLATGRAVLERFGFDDDPDDPDAVWAPALRCGGRVEVLVAGSRRSTSTWSRRSGGRGGRAVSLALSLSPRTVRSAPSWSHRTGAAGACSSSVPTSDRAASWSVPSRPRSR